MSKKSLIFDYIFTFVITFLVLLSSFFVTNTIEKNDAKNTLISYTNEVIASYEKDNSFDTIKLNYGKVKDLRISIFDEYANVKLEINQLDKQPYNENRKEELVKNEGKFYYKKSNTLGVDVFYYVKLSNNLYFRLGIPKSNIENMSNLVLIYGSLTLVLFDTAYFYIKYRVYKKEFNKLKNSFGQLQKKVDFTPIDTKDVISYVEKNIDKLNITIKEKIDELKIENNKISFILDSINEGVFVINSDENVILINSYMEKLIKNKRENIIGKNYRFLLLGEDFSDKLGEKIVSESSIDKEIDGRIYEFLINKISLNWLKPNNENGYAILVFDVTDARLNEKLKKEFFQNASHELKTPLTTIIGYNELLSKNLIVDKEEILNAETSINLEAKRMQRIIDDMLSLATLESGISNKNRVDIDAKNAILEIVKSFEYQINLKKIKVSTNLSDVHLNMNIEDFDHLIRNLFSNAIKYNVEGGKINVTLTENYFSISDTGIGIESKYLSRIFERFFRVDKGRSRKQGGTGLGLAIVKHICLNYKYRITVQSDLGKGTTFTIYFR